MPMPGRMRGRKPKAARRGKDGVPEPPDALPRCPGHLSPIARKEWRRLAKPLHDMGVLSVVDRGALAAYCQAWGRWVEAEEQLKHTPVLLKTPSGYVQQSPWLSIANKQLELMGRYMAELGLTPSARNRVGLAPAAPGTITLADMLTEVRFIEAQPAAAVLDPVVEDAEETAS